MATEYVKMTTEEMADKYTTACLDMQISLAKLLGKEVDDPDVLDFGQRMLLAVKWQQEYSMQLAMDTVNKEWGKK